ncbi:hypothetical protein PoB_001577100 [Plakobranchus ocellatus]|uniref:Uncharacterized protein n=1 Tax=Plakobranchus ocellatus TaxID=259542 RepID=A0AAV3Z0E1_9GAST|nr:hypothetical protein PoB_001577100 [Plakobranchus ocellatus]
MICCTNCLIYPRYHQAICTHVAKKNSAIDSRRSSTACGLSALRYAVPVVWKLGGTAGTNGALDLGVGEGGLVFSFPPGTVLRKGNISSGDHAVAWFGERRGEGRRDGLAYSGQLSRSNLSLSVDPSVGASSLLHQKSLSSPYFVSSLDSPRVLEHLHGDIRDAIRVTPSPGVLPNQGQAFQVVSRSGPVTSGIPNHTDAFGHSGLSGSLSTGNIASQGSISSIGGTTDTGSSPQLSEVEDPEVRIVSGGRTSSAEASGPGLPLGGVQSPQGSGQTIPAGLEDSLSWGDTGAFSATTGSSDLEDGFLVQMRQKQPASHRDEPVESLSRGEDETHDILEHSNNYRQKPKSFSDAFLYEHSQSGSASTDSEQQGMAVPGRTETGDSGISSFQYGQHQPQAIESSNVPGSTSSPCDLPGVSSYPSQEVVSRIRGSATSDRGSQASRASHVSVALDATSLNSVLTCETDYGTDGVVLGFSPPDANPDSRQPDHCTYPGDQNLPQAEASSDQTDFRNRESDLPEAGRSPSGSPSNSTVAEADSEKSGSFKSGAKSKMSAIRSHPHLTMSDPLLSPSPSLPGLSQSLGNPTYAYPHLRNPLEADLAASPPSFSGTVLPFSEADLYCFSPPISPHTPLSGRAGSEEKGDQNLGSRESISTSVKYSGGNIYIPDRGLSLDRGLTGISAAFASASQVSDTSNNHIRSSQAGEAGEEGKTAIAAAATSTASFATTTATATAAAGVSSPHRRGHKRWVSDTSVIQVNQEQNRLRRSSKTNQYSTGIYGFFFPSVWRHLPSLPPASFAFCEANLVLQTAFNYRTLGPRLPLT